MTRHPLSGRGTSIPEIITNMRNYNESAVGVRELKMLNARRDLYV